MSRILSRNIVVIIPKEFSLNTLNHALRDNSEGENELEISYAIY